MRQNESPESGLWYLISGVAIGTVLGMLFAPKKGSELREDISDWGRQGREKTDAMITRINTMVPLRVKAAAGIGALKAGGAEAIREVAESLHLDGANE